MAARLLLCIGDQRVFVDVEYAPHVVVCEVLVAGALGTSSGILLLLDGALDEPFRGASRRDIEFDDPSLESADFLK